LLSGSHDLPDEAFAAASRPPWTIAALGALAIHAAVCGLVLHYTRDTATELGAPGLVFDIDLTAPQRDPTDLPVGADAEASSPSPAVIAEKTVVPEADLAKAIPIKADDPDLAVTLDEKKKPDQEDPKFTAVEAVPSNSSVTSETTAIPSVRDAPPSPRSVTPSPGTGTSAVAERVTWEKELAAHFDKYKRYPEDRAARSAEVIVNFVLDDVGDIVSSRIVKGSGDPVFDEAALSMLQRSDPVPPPPPLVAGAGLSFTMPVIFHVKAQN
jgi:periplasmic protein TonB